ncbi:SfnB family sulfur acquisition oxidoreductase [Nocardioides currus]|uniref:SfnB family sulfur acquisition oxidoreductase n=1 Tax=Nocardioides currus TaxID=2133958 RepID=A0A2R7Z185_9ACTN|nr:SfnB family sulfur acquisition oxidoreductase [Nocardioides currus]PUA82388.1 SfnB family sulfur acquisition oxidoreductase [Nocardioides currus]
MTAVAHAPVVTPTWTSEQAVSVARTLAAHFAETASQRDAERILPGPELDRLAESGLLAITVPQEHGGPDLPAVTLAEVFRVLATGDPSIAQVPQSHFVYVNAMRDQGTPEQQEFFFGEVLAGKRFGNAQSEIGTKHVRDIRTTLRPSMVEVRAERASRPRSWLLNGTKGYATGALFADWIPVLAHLDVDGPLHVAWIERTAPGVRVIDDWDGMGQRTTASGTVELVDVHVADDRITPYHQTFDRPQTYGSFAQLLHSAIDVGIARAAIEEAAEFVRTRSRPFPDAGVDRAGDDPLVVHALGQMEVAVRGAEALLREAGRAVDAATADLTAQSAGTASLAVAASRASSTAVSVEVASRLFEVSGTRSALGALNLDRHWRNARTHTLHDPAAWKVQHLGRWVVDRTLPPNHGQL